MDLRTLERYLEELLCLSKELEVRQKEQITSLKKRYKLEKRIFLNEHKFQQLRMKNSIEQYQCAIRREQEQAQKKSDKSPMNPFKILFKKKNCHQDKSDEPKTSRESGNSSTTNSS